MKRSRRFLVWSFAAALALVALGPTPPATAAEYVCPPCESPCDEQVFAEAGNCPVCGMELAVRGQVRRAAILIFPGVQIIDFAGPYEVFGQAGFEVFTVAKSPEPMLTTMSLNVTPTYTFEDAPQATVLIVPGGRIQPAEHDAATLEWVRRQAQGADHVLSVCNGAFILARAGLLEGQTATTFYGLIDQLAEAAPGAKIVRDQRYTDNGKILTSAGLSSGVDASLHVVSKYRGTGGAKQLALHMEYQWDPASKFARAALADRAVAGFDVLDGYERRLLDTGGDRDRWEWRWRVESDASQSELEAELRRRAAAREGWRADGSMRWRFRDRESREWRARAEVRPDGGDAYHVRLAIERAGASGG